jgi:hypothetical protein
MSAWFGMSGANDTLEPTQENYFVNLWLPAALDADEYARVKTEPIALLKELYPSIFYFGARGYEIEAFLNRFKARLDYLANQAESDNVKYDSLLEKMNRLPKWIRDKFLINNRQHNILNLAGAMVYGRDGNRVLLAAYPMGSEFRVLWEGMDDEYVKERINFRWAYTDEGRWLAHYAMLFQLAWPELQADTLYDEALAQFKLSMNQLGIQL